MRLPALSQQDGQRDIQQSNSEIYRRSGKEHPKLMEYAGPLRVKKLAKDLIGVWL